VLVHVRWQIIGWLVVIHKGTSHDGPFHPTRVVSLRVQVLLTTASVRSNKAKQAGFQLDVL